jgi:hypothetical protein
MWITHIYIITKNTIIFSLCKPIFCYTKILPTESVGATIGRPPDRTNDPDFRRKSPDCIACAMRAANGRPYTDQRKILQGLLFFF